MHLLLFARLRFLSSISFLLSLYFLSSLSSFLSPDPSTSTNSSSSSLFGEPVLVTDGIILPACLLTVVTTSGELWSFSIRPSVVPSDCDEGAGMMTDNEGAVVSGVTVCYQVNFRHNFSKCVCFCLFLSVHVKVGCKTGRKCVKQFNV